MELYVESEIFVNFYTVMKTAVEPYHLLSFFLCMYDCYSHVGYFIAFLAQRC